jgi:4-amino-4-deoxy-L-arabinose transferase-like glycosyltransferase
MSDAGSGPRVRRAAWVAVIALALATRAGIALAMPREILWRDGREFEGVALSLLAGEGYGTQTLRPPGYPTFIAAVYALAGSSLVALRLVEALLATAAVALAGWAGARWFGSLAGWTAALLMALHPILAMLPATQFSESLLALVLVCAFAATCEAWRRGGAARWAAAGALFGLAALVRPNAVLVLPGLAVGLLLALRRDRRPWLVPGAAAATALLLVIAPWIVRCHRVHGEWYFVATGGGRQFFLGNSERATGSTTDVIHYRPEEQAALAALPNDMARERWHYRVSLEAVRRDPGRAARLYALKVRNLFALWPETVTQTFLNLGTRWSQGVASVLLFAGALLALLRLRDTPALWPLLGAVVSFALAQAVFHSVLRYRMAIEPCLLWMAGAGWAGRSWVEAFARRVRITG